MFGIFLLLTYYLQQTLGYSPLVTGVAFLPISGGLIAARLIGRQALTGLALAHGYDTAFWWIAGIFVGGAVIGGTLLRRGPLASRSASSDRRANPRIQVTATHQDGR